MGTRASVAQTGLRTSFWRRPRLGSGLLLVAGLALAGCGGDDDTGVASVANNLGGGCEVVTVDDAAGVLGRPARMPKRFKIAVLPEDWLVQACIWEADVPADVSGAARLEYRLWGPRSPGFQEFYSRNVVSGRPIDVGERGFYHPQGAYLEFELGGQVVSLQVVPADPEARVQFTVAQEAALTELARKVEVVLSTTTSTSTP